MKIFLLGALLCTFACDASMAHITLETPKTTAGETYKAVLRVGHGCAGSLATTALTVAVPEGVVNAKPMPKIGWRVAVKREALVKPFVEHGKTITERVYEITWVALTKEAPIQDWQFDEFVLRATMPKEAGILWWKVLQSCEEGGTTYWSEIPEHGQHTTSTKGLKLPAASLQILPATLPSQDNQAAQIKHH